MLRRVEVPARPVELVRWPTAANVAPSVQRFGARPLQWPTTPTRVTGSGGVGR